MGTESEHVEGSLTLTAIVTLMRCSVGSFGKTPKKFALRWLSRVERDSGTIA